MFLCIQDQTLKNINHIKNNTQLSDNTKKKYLNEYQLPDGIFITAYDENMNTRECLGQWFDNQYKNKSWNTFIEDNLVKKVIRLAKTTSRLTGGQYIDIPVSFYTITYLYKDRSKQFIRGWHAILKDSLYLPNVFLENTYDNGLWFNSTHTKWHKGSEFNMKYTFKKLLQKSGKKLLQKSGKISKKLNNKKYTLFYSEQIHKPINL